MASPTPDVVLGQGALGTLFAAGLAGGERDVHLVSRRAEREQEVELAVRGRKRTRRARVTLGPDVPDQARLVVVATRADQALERARQAHPSLADEGLLVPVQNGLVPLEVADALDEGQVAPGVVGFNAQLVDERTVAVTSPGDVTVGALAPQAEPAVRALSDDLEGPVRVDTSPNARGAVWSKFCVSCAINGLAVVAGEGVGTITRKREGREALVAVLTEGTELAEAGGVELERVAGPLRPDTIAGNASTGLGGAFRRGVTWLIGRRYRDVTPSSIHALREGRDPELDALNAEAVRRGEELDVPMPWNRAVLDLAREVEAGKREPSMANLDELRQRARA